ncbi:MAG: 5'/3'-nucleotidase SurE [Chloroflexi bacterium]|nr:5'/3'-nucleotidase SurE [Chloroflexota bacterium]
MTGYILISNDDGVDAPGLLALKHGLEKIGEVRVIAPDRNWSAAGHAKTLHRPLRVRPTSLADGSDAYKCDGAPSDCVAVALLGFFSERPALVVSGINPNANVGSDITYSGTVAAAMEAAIDGVPAIAVSLDVDEQARHFATAGEYAARLAQRVLENGLPPDTLLNVNVPDAALSEIRGVAITRCGKRIYYDQLITRQDPFGHPYYWIGGERPGGDKELHGTDIWALANHYVSITPVHVDMTNHALIAELESWASQLQAR